MPKIRAWFKLSDLQSKVGEIKDTFFDAWTNQYYAEIYCEETNDYYFQNFSDIEIIIPKNVLIETT
jgi:hypothetical protein